MRAMTDPAQQESSDAPAIQETHSNTPSAEPKGLTFWQVLGSTFAAATGVQSSKNRERDFSQGKPSQFIFMGIAFTAAFVLIMVVVVSLVLP